ncbi:MAG: TetR/AcrR family transcriptional regulator [Pseudomonadota bacterium]
MNDQAVKKRGRGRPRLDASDGRDDIKRAALAEFAQHGFKGASIDQIAARAGVAKRLIHYHFGSKDVLWKEAVSEAYDDFRNEVFAFATTLQGADAEDVTDAVVLQLVRFAAKRVELILISIDENRQGGERSDWLRSTYLNPLQQLMASLLVSFVGDTERGKALAAHLIPGIFGTIIFPFVDATVVSEALDTDVFSDAYAEEHARFVARVLRAGLVA